MAVLRPALPAAATLIAVTVALLASSPAFAQPSLPATFYGAATVDGAPPREGAEVRGFIDGKDCTQGAPGRSPISIENGVSAYVILVVHETQVPGCGREGKTITFTIDGRPASQTAPWRVGLVNLNLNAGTGSPATLPPATPTPGAAPTAVRTSAAEGQGATPGRTVTAVPATALPTDDIPNPLAGGQGTPANGPTPLPPNAAGASSGGGQVSSVEAPRAAESGGGGNTGWFVLLIVAGVLGLAGTGAGYWLSQRSRKTGTD